MLLFFIGMPGAGKSFWVEKTANSFSCIGLDLDGEIEQRKGSSIAALFSVGDANFRRIEKEILLELIKEYTKKKLHTIIATGGGTPCFHENLKLMKSVGIVIYLKETIENLLPRILSQTKVRPLLKESKEELFNQLTELEEKRKSVYEQAHFTMEMKTMSLSEFSQQINQIINSKNLNLNV